MFPFFNNYPGTDLHEIDLAYILKVCNEMLERVRAQDDKIAAVEQLAQDLKDFVNNYFDNLDVQQEINAKINAMVLDGSLERLLEDDVSSTTAEWLAEHITPTTPAVDSSLSIAGAAADAKATGDAIADVMTIINAGSIPLDNVMTSSNWELGDINSSTGQNVNRSTVVRLKTAAAFYGENSVIKTLTGGYYVYAYKYTDSGCTQFVGEVSSILNFRGVTLIQLENGYYYRIKAIRVGGGTINVSEIPTILTTFTTLHGSGMFNNAVDIDTLENRYYLAYGVNRNPNVNTPGYLHADGTITELNDWTTTDYCYVKDLAAVIGSANNIGSDTRVEAALHFMCTYTEDKEFIEQVYTTGPVTYTVGANVAYVRFCYHANVIENVMLEEGTTFTPYFIPYEAPQIKLKPEYYESAVTWGGKTWVAFGDSLTEENTMAAKRYYDYVSDATGIDVTVMGESGSGYKRADGENKAFYQRISNVPVTADVITIFGSFNDLGSGAALGTASDTGTTTIGGCINTTLDNLFSRIPLANVGIVTPTPWKNQNPLNEPDNASAYVDLIIETCRRRGIPCLDLFHESLLRPWDATFREAAYSNDSTNGVHPDENGHKLIAPRFMNFLQSLLL